MLIADKCVSNMSIGNFSGIIAFKNTSPGLYICFLLYYEGTV